MVAGHKTNSSSPDCSCTFSSQCCLIGVFDLHPCTDSVSGHTPAAVPAAALTIAVDRAHNVAFKGTEIMTTSGDAAKTSSMLLRTARLQMWHTFQKVILSFESN